MAKKLSNFGKAMAMLDISIMDIAQMLFIDKTTVSKWRSGSRKLLKRSPYFNDIVEIMVNKENMSEDHPFTSMWAKTHSMDDFSDEALRNYMEDFILASENVEHDALLSSMDDSGLLPQFKCYIGVEGRKKALDHILQVAERMSGQCI